jgi:hypothetical protein
MEPKTMKFVRYCQEKDCMQRIIIEIEYGKMLPVWYCDEHKPHDDLQKEVN